MFPITARQRQLLKESHTALFRADVVRADQKLAELVVTGGDVTTEDGIAIQGSTSFTLVDPDGSMTVTEATDLLSPYGTEIKLWRGIGTGAEDPDDDLIPQGVFRITKYGIRDAASGGIETQIVGYDRALRCEGSLDHDYPIQAGIAYETALVRMLLEKQPGLTFRMVETDLTTRGMLLPKSKNVWTEARRIARSFGCRLRFDRNGICVLEPVAVKASGTFVWEFIEGDNADFWDIDRSLYTDDLANVVVIESSVRQGIEGRAADMDPKSPTYSQGLYGEVVYSESSELVVTQTQANAAAAGILADKLGASEDVTFSAVPNPALDIGDTVEVTRESLGIEQRQMIVRKVVLPMTATDPMTVTCRRSILTEQDGFQNTATVDA